MFGSIGVAEAQVRSADGMTPSMAASVIAGEEGLPGQKALKVWLAPASLSQAEIGEAAAQVKASGALVVDDPAEEAWTERLEWDGSAWVLVPAPVSGELATDAKARRPVIVGAALTAAKLKRALGAGAKLWVDLPPSRELAMQLHLRGEGSAVEVAKDRAEATYVLAGTLGKDGPAYAWFHRAEYEGGVAAGKRGRHTPGCSTTSSYPVRTAWVAAQHGTAAEDASGELEVYALRLAKVDGWLQVAGAAGAGSAFQLAISQEQNGRLLGLDEPVKAGESLFLSLVAKAKVESPRWVYVLDIDCQGNGNLLYPVDSSVNRVPNAAGGGLRKPLLGARKIEVGPPYGMDSLILLSTEEPLPDPDALNFDGVGGSGARGIEAQREMPTSWSVAMRPLLSEAHDPK